MKNRRHVALSVALAAAAAAVSGAACSPASAAGTSAPSARPAAARSVVPVTVTPAGYKPCYLAPGYQKFAHFRSAHRTAAGTTVTLVLETCVYNTHMEEEVRYTPTSRARTFTFAPNASVKVVDDTAQPKRIPVSALPTWKDVNSGHFWVRLDSRGRVAGMQEIFHP